MRINNLGFTMIELLIAMSIFSIISVSAVYLVFSSLSLRDQTLAAIRTQEQLRVFSHTLRGAIQNSPIVTGGGDTLSLTSSTVCWSFVYDSALEILRYAKTLGAGCAPEPIPPTAFFSPTSHLNELTFTITPLSTGGRQVSVEGNISVVLPFDDYDVDFKDTFTNLID